MTKHGPRSKKPRSQNKPQQHNAPIVTHQSAENIENPKPSADQAENQKTIRRKISDLGIDIKINLIFTFMLVVFTGFYAATSCHQLSAVKEQVTQMTKSVEQTQTLISQQQEALEYAKTQANLAKESIESNKQASVPVIQLDGWDMKPSPIIADQKTTITITLGNRGSSDVTNAVNHITIESRKDEPPENYQANWKTTNNVGIQRNFGQRTFEVSTSFPKSEVEQIGAGHRFICVFGYLEYRNPLGVRIRKRYCVKFGNTARECERWQNQEEIHE